MSNLILNRYQPIIEAGTGGFASVVVAWDTVIQRSVAIKCIPLGDAAASIRQPDRYDEVIESFEPEMEEFNVPDWVSPFRKQGANPDTGKSSSPLSRGSKKQKAAPPSISLLSAGLQGMAEVPGLEEARTAAHLNDANIVQVYNFEIQDDTAYLILEYVEGMSLGDLLRRYAHLMDADIVAALFKAISHALEVAHKNHVLHLDIKPDNVLIDCEGKIKVVDFGLSRLAGENGFGHATGGTIGYMPPEQMNQEELDERCDEWALASLTYEMISGKNPFKVSRLEDAEDAIYGAEIVIPSLCMDGLDESIDDIMFCALDPDRRNRYNSVKAFAKEMKPCLGNPGKGKKKLAEIVSSTQYNNTEEEYEAPEREMVQEELTYTYRGPLLERMSDRVKQIALRVWAMLSVAVLGAVSVVNIPFLGGDWGNPWIGGILAAVLIVTAIFPKVGSLIALELFGLTMLFQGSIICGLLIMLSTAAWWFFAGRFSLRQCLVVMAPGLFGAIGLMPLAALFAGYFARAKDALSSGVCALILAFALASLGSLSLVTWDIFSNLTIGEGSNLNANMMALIVQPATWLFALAWMLTCLVGAFACLKQNRAIAVIGLIFGEVLMVGAVIIGALVLAGMVGSSASFTTDAAGSVNTFAVLGIVLCGVVMSAVVAIFGVPEPEFEEE